MSAAEDFNQIRMQFIDPLQYAYEVIRPIVLFGDTAAERSRQTGVERTGSCASILRVIPNRPQTP